ncbi:MAG TPA: SCP2 sterol-binding domain-containing protein [Acidimicrobiales bacterium]|nr:SCP2 sterol-binding domain-containing protein [Acidimicrobiales bacterium]
MPKFLSPEWVAAVNALLDGLSADELEAAATGSLAAATGHFRVSQVVRGAPGAAGAPGPATVRTTLVVEGGRAHLELEDQDPDARGLPPDVELELSYDDAAALSRGDLEPGEALGTGRVRVRGDLSVLMAGQAMLQAAARRLAGLQADTTY